MSVCPKCRREVKQGSGNKRKIKKGTWAHKECDVEGKQLKRKGDRVKRGEKG